MHSLLVENVFLFLGVEMKTKKMRTRSSRCPRLEDGCICKGMAGTIIRPSQVFSVFRFAYLLGFALILSYQSETQKKLAMA